MNNPKFKVGDIVCVGIEPENPLRVIEVSPGETTNAYLCETAIFGYFYRWAGYELEEALFLWGEVKEIVIKQQEKRLEAMRKL